VCDPAGVGTGVAKSRAAIHRDGDWHRAFHCWILRRDGTEVVLQRRSLLKDTFAGLWDAAAAGHWRFGESAAEAAREIAEELGLEVPFEILDYRCRERASHDFPNGLIDREFHEVYILRDDRPLTAYRPDPAEVSDVAAFKVNELITLADAQVDTISATESWSGNEIHVTRPELVPYSTARLRGMLLSG